MKINKILGLAVVISAAAVSAPLPAAGAAPANLGAQTEKIDHDITRAQVVNRAILAVMENYYDPARVDSQAMFKEAMEAIQLMVAEVKVDFDEEAGRAVVEVPGDRLAVKLDDVRSPWGLSKALKRVFVFVKAKLDDPDRDWLTLEYVVVNAILSVLDPHTSAMMPDQWAELRMAIRGEFEGVGIRITTDRRPPCNGDLTVVEVFDDTPAKRAGLLKGDKILEIDGESTVNITTSEAADRLRGTPGTSVKVLVRRTDGSRKTISISRGKIPIESVEWKMLDGKVGYVYLESFSDNSGTEMKAALRALHEKKMKGLVLDLRGNPGGSLDVAIEIADLFLDSGTIVTTAGRSEEERDVENASSKGTEPAYPVVVLISSGSASAAEILAGALRNHGKSLLVGKTTFGKGSVQRLMPLPAGGALRITTAQYLTPGDISIQAVGVAPDVELVPVIIDREDLNLDVSAPAFSEADLDAHLTRPNARARTDRPGALKYRTYIPPAKRDADMKKFEKCYLETGREDLFMGRMEKDFARDLIGRAGGWTTAELFLDAGEMIDRDSAEQDKSISRALKKMGVDWSPAPEGAQTGEKDERIEVSAAFRGAPVPGKTLRLKATVKNGSDEPVYRLRAVTKSDNPLMDERELVFGKVAPGKRKSWEARIEIPRVVSARVDPVTIEFFSQGGPIPGPVSVDLEMPDQPRVKLAYSWQMEDLGNGNGYWEPGEEILMRVELLNAGERKTHEVDANLSAKPGVNVSQGHFEVAPLAPGKTASGEFRLKIADDFPLDEAQLQLSVQEWIPARHPLSMSLLSRQIDLPIAAASPSPSSASGTVTVAAKGGTALLADPSEAGKVVAVAPEGAVFPVDGRIGEYFRVELERDMHAWLRESETAPGGKGKPRFELSMERPPTVKVEGERAFATERETIELRGFAEHEKGVRDMVVFAGDTKVAYLPNGDRGRRRMSFSVKVPLEIGENQITVVARHDEENTSTEWVFVRRNER